MSYLNGTSLGPVPLLLVDAADHVVVLRVALLPLFLQEPLHAPLLLVELRVEVGDALLQALLQDLVVLQVQGGYSVASWSFNR